MINVLRCERSAELNFPIDFLLPVALHGPEVAATHGYTQQRIKVYVLIKLTFLIDLLISLFIYH